MSRLLRKKIVAVQVRIYSLKTLFIYVFTIKMFYITKNNILNKVIYIKNKLINIWKLYSDYTKNFVRNVEETYSKIKNLRFIILYF